MWSNWKKFPPPELGRQFGAKAQPGVYQIRNVVSNELVLFGISNNLQKRMKSLYPKPFGTGTRNATDKREYILENHQNLEYRIIYTDTRIEAAQIEQTIKSENNHLFNR